MSLRLPDVYGILTTEYLVKHDFPIYIAIADNNKQNTDVFSKYLCIMISISNRKDTQIKGDRNPDNKYILSERALKTMNFDTSVIKIG